jgi:hypothetical protein
LYEESGRRSYGDSDLFVAPSHFQEAEGILRNLGFSFVPAEEVVHGRPALEHKWHRPEDGMVVDLHQGLLGVDLDMDGEWEVLSRHRETMTLAGTEVQILDEAGRTFHLALHAFQHGKDTPKPLKDLEIALARVSDETWNKAASLAEKLQASEGFVTGLRLLEEGRALAARLELEIQPTVAGILLASSPPRFAFGLEWLSQAPGVLGKARYVFRAFIPPRSVMEQRNGGNKLSPAGLARAYLSRWWMLLRHGPAAVRAWWRAKRSVS